MACGEERRDLCSPGQRIRAGVNCQRAGYVEGRDADVRASTSASESRWFSGMSVLMLARMRSVSRSRLWRVSFSPVRSALITSAFFSIISCIPTRSITFRAAVTRADVLSGCESRHSATI